MTQELTKGIGAALLTITLLIFAPPVAATTGTDDPPVARDSETPAKGEKAATPATATVEELLRQQAAQLKQLHELLLEQQAEIESLRSELDEVRSRTVPANSASDVVASAPARVVEPAAAGAAVEPPASTTPTQADDELARQVEELNKRLGNINLSGDVRFRYEGFYNQGLDGPRDLDPRNRLRFRARMKLTGKINEHMDWGLGFSTGNFNEPISTNQTLGDFFNRKTFALDRFYLHYDTKNEHTNLEVFAGKFERPWKATSLTFDGDLNPEGLAEQISYEPGSGPLNRLEFTAWQLPIREVSVGADAFIFGGQILADFRLADNWGATLAGSFHDFEQVDLIIPALNVSSTLVNAGLSYGSTNAIGIDPLSGRATFLSDYRVIDAIAELRYTGFGPRFPLTLQAEFLHNTSAFNNQRDGGLATIAIGRTKEKGDLYLEYAYWRAEREVYPSVFMNSDVLPTNGENQWVEVQYMYNKRVALRGQYILQQRLQTQSPVNRWLNRLQLDVIYKF